MFCPQCGTTNAPDAQFCIYCGIPLTYESGLSSAQPPSSEGYPPVQAESIPAQSEPDPSAPAQPAPAPAPEPVPFVPTPVQFVPPPIQPVPPPMPYGYPPYPAAVPVQPTTTNGCAVAGFVLSLVSIFLVWVGTFTALLGVILSGVGISQANRLGQGGKGLGIAGVIISSIILFFYFLIIMLAVIFAITLS